MATEVQRRYDEGELHQNQAEADSMVTPWLDVSWAGFLSIALDIAAQTLDNAGDEYDFYFQTSYNDGDDAVDLENFHLDNADDGGTNHKIFTFGDGPYAAVDPPVDSTDGTLADDTKNDLPLGRLFRIKLVVVKGDAPTCTWAARYSMRA